MSKAVVKANKEADRKNVVTPVRHIPYGVRRRLSSEVKEVVREVIVEKIVERIVEVEKAPVTKAPENSVSSEGKVETKAPVAKGRKAAATGKKGEAAVEASIESPASQVAENSADIGSIEEKTAHVTTGIMGSAL